MILNLYTVVARVSPQLAAISVLAFPLSELDGIRLRV